MRIVRIFILKFQTLRNQRCRRPPNLLSVSYLAYIALGTFKLHGSYMVLCCALFKTKGICLHPGDINLSEIWSYIF